LFVIAAIVISQTREQALDNFSQLSEREARQVDNAITMFFAEIAKNVDYLASHTTIKNARTNVKTHMDASNSVMLNHPNQSPTHPGLTFIYMGNEQGGYIQWPMGKVNANYDPRERPWYIAAKAANGKTTRTNAYYWAADDLVIVSTVKAIIDNGQLIGA